MDFIEIFEFNRLIRLIALNVQCRDMYFQFKLQKLSEYNFLLASPS